MFEGELVYIFVNHKVVIANSFVEMLRHICVVFVFGYSNSFGPWY